MTGTSPAILFSDYQPSRFNGGEELVLRTAILGLAARGRRCLLAYHKWGDLVPEYEAAGIQCRQFDLSPIRATSPGAFLKSIAGQAIWARREGVGLLHCNSYFRAAHARAVKSLGGFPSICQFHLPAPPYLSRQYRWGLRRLDGYIAVSACTAAEWSRALGAPRGRIEVLYNPIDTNRFWPDDKARASARREIGANDDCLLLGYCGRLVEEKGVDVLIRATARLVADHRNVRLVVLGNDAQNVTLHGEPLKPKLKALARQLGLADHVDFLDARQDVERWYNAIDVLVAPSVYAEPFGLVIAEALACGRPAVATRIGGIPEILTAPLDELLVPPGDEKTLATVLRRLIDDPQRRTQLGRLGREIVQRKFLVSLFLDGLEQIYERAMTFPFARAASAAE